MHKLSFNACFQLMTETEKVMKPIGMLFLKKKAQEEQISSGGL